MKILLDTSYLLPLIKVRIKEIPEAIIQKLLMDSKLDLFYCDITIFELTAKGTKLIISGEQLKLTDIQKGIDALENDDRITRLSWSEHPLTLDLAFSLRKIHSDYIDCLILATAVCYTDMIITFNNKLFNLIKQTPSLIEEILRINDHFQFWFKDLTKDPKELKKITKIP